MAASANTACLVRSVSFLLRGETVEQMQEERHVVILHAQLSLSTVSASSFAVLPDYSQQVPLLHSFAVNKFQWKTSHALICWAICIIAALSGSMRLWGKQFLFLFPPSCNVYQDLGPCVAGEKRLVLIGIYCHKYCPANPAWNLLPVKMEEVCGQKVEMFVFVELLWKHRAMFSPCFHH